MIRKILERLLRKRVLRVREVYFVDGPLAGQRGWVADETEAYVVTRINSVPISYRPMINNPHQWSTQIQ